MYAIGYDIGSSSIKVALIESTTGKKIRIVQEPTQEMEILALKGNWAEQHPDTWWKHICTATQNIIEESGIDKKLITSVGIAYQMHGLVLINKAGNVLRNAIIWCDSRAIEIGENAYHSLGHSWCASHLLNAPGNFTASKLKWIKEHEPAVYKEIYKYLLPGDYIAYKLTGKCNTTINGLTEGTLWDYSSNEVATKLLDHYNIDQKLTPELTQNFTNQGSITELAAIKTGLPTSAIVRYRAGDQPNNALSLNIFKPGEVAATAGTSGVIYAVTAQRDFKEISKVNQFAHVNYTPEKPIVGRLLNINGCGIQYRWLKNTFNEISYQEMNEQAALVPVGSEGLIAIPFGNGAERMLNNKNIGTQFSNINLNIHAKHHMYRAALEGIAFSFVYGMGILKEDNTEVSVIRAGNDNLFRSEIFALTVATLIGQEIEIYDTTGAIGAARATIITPDNYKQFSKIIKKNDHIITYKPLQEDQAYRHAYDAWKETLEHKLKSL